ncbi:DNA topoisomerase 3-beta-1-like protein [Chrysochromulina tobinii]|uniref:DNA topoisomerase n=2 Tax=Chrysochromulina tobinii TaxID=1460289 RepID=A0A0M0K9E9_9EUKA|nr:DNA topoisomerase 3-beta-1-like protein [Chrysochromulina tobinii]|eukprot:KOO35242.1 DNA topoisomerase 3-beta-1-like protein [Chrysochromulina sp. CCMP291]
MARSAAGPQLRGRSASPKSRSTPTGAGTTQWGRSVAETYDDASVLHIADRPSVALAIAEALSSGNRRTRGHGLLKVHDCFGHFPPAGNKSCSFAITSVCGHLQSLELVAPIGEPRERDLRELFGAKMRRVAEPASERVGVREHLARESHGRGWVCFWTSCDLEGESIIFEVLRCLPRFTPDRVWRARFSSIAPAALQRSLRRLVKPDPTGAAAVDARLELELKTYLAFSRLLTRALRQAVREALSLPRVRTLTYGMGHIAVLGLCVTRKREVRLHRPTPFYDIRATVTILAPKETKETAKRSKGGPSFARPKSPRKGGASGGDMPAELKARLEAAVEAAAAAESSASVVEALAANQARELYLQDVLKKAPYWARTADGAVLGTAASGAELTRKGQTVPDRTIEMQWCGGPTHSKVQAEKMMSLFKHGSNRTGSKPELLVLSVAHEERRLPPPAGLSELGLLRIGADYLCLSGERTLAVAEELYARGLITYPRTHSTKYPSNLDVVGTLSLLATEQTDFAPLARWLLLAPPPVPRRGEASGEHPPILPVGRLSRKEVETSCGMHGWHVYEAVCVHFLASLFPDAVYQEKRLQAKLDNASHTFEFATTWHKILDHGWMHAQPWRLKDLGMKLEGIEPELDAYLPGDTIQNVQIDLTVGFTPPPKPFTEAELYSLLHANGVGTDGSLPQHLGAAVRSGYLEIRSAGGRVIGDVGNGDDRGAGAGSERATALAADAADAAIEVTGEPAGSADATPDPMMTLTARKGYVRPPLLPGRYVVPTRLGIAIYDGLAHCDRELVAPSLRATLEKQVAYIATLPPPAAVGDTASSVIAKDVVNAALEALAGRFDTCRARLDGFRSLLKQRPLASTAAETEERKLVRDVVDGAASKCESTAKSEAAQATSRTPRAHASSGHIPSPLRHGSPAAEVRETAGAATARAPAPAAGLFDFLAVGKAGASHILLPPGSSKARYIKEEIEKGRMTFEAAAKEFSECPSASKGGNLGTFGRGQMVGPFDSYCFDPDSKVGALEIVKTSFGTHIVKLTKKP